jgi:hypothetical protein
VTVDEVLPFKSKKDRNERWPYLAVRKFYDRYAVESLAANNLQGLLWYYMTKPIQATDD